MKVGDLIKLMEHLDQTKPRDAHQDLQDCQCTPCEKDRTEGCENPNACVRTAEQIINKLYPKFKPSTQPLNDDGLSLSPNKRNKNREAMKEEKGIITFNPSIQIEDDPSKCFHIFTDPKAKCKTQANRGRALPLPHPPRTEIFFEGAAKIREIGANNTGSGLWYWENDVRNAAIRTQREDPSVEAGELIAILWVTQEEPANRLLHFIGSSKDVIWGLTTQLEDREEWGYIGIKNKDLYKSTVAALCQRLTPTMFQRASGPNTQPGNREARKLALEAASHKDKIFDELITEIDPRFNLTGAQLSKMTQMLAYQGICETKILRYKQGMACMLDITRYVGEEAFGSLPSNEAIWWSIQDKDIPRSCWTFLWKALHNAHKVGSYWERITSHEHRSLCHECGGTDDLEHIMLTCTHSGQEKVWELAEELWNTKTKGKIPWPTMRNIGSITRCTLANFSKKKTLKTPRKEKTASINSYFPNQ